MISFTRLEFSYNQKLSHDRSKTDSSAESFADQRLQTAGEFIELIVT